MIAGNEFEMMTAGTDCPSFYFIFNFMVDHLNDIDRRRSSLVQIAH